MVSKVYAEPAIREPRRMQGASASGERLARPGRRGTGSLVCDGTFALRRALWLARSASPARDWLERLGWGGGPRQSAALAGARRQRGAVDLEEEDE
jgi:hypothetical protein